MCAVGLRTGQAHSKDKPESGSSAKILRLDLTGRENPCTAEAQVRRVIEATDRNQLSFRRSEFSAVFNARMKSA